MIKLKYNRFNIFKYDKKNNFFNKFRTDKDKYTTKKLEYSF